LLIETPAKINLALNVVGKRQDGYHLVETVMQSIALYDRLEIEVTASEPELHCAIPELAGDDNLVLRAARLLREEHGVAQGCRLELAKGIPVAAGLGGGSSDAAAVLSALNELWELGLEQEALSSLAAKLGSDVPFFIYGGTALAEGRGELVTPLPGLPRLELVLIKADFPLLTREVYGAGDFALTENKGTAKLLARELEKAPQKVRLLPASPAEQDEGGEERALSVAEFLVNDLESGAFLLRPELKELKEELSAVCGRGVLMSGSGPTFFALCRDREEAVARAELLVKAGHKALVTHTL
jgi:4-diphosphocytidyl-2-C-methyl-D-erythritol kinase